MVIQFVVVVGFVVVCLYSGLSVKLRREQRFKLLVLRYRRAATLLQTSPAL
jgi:hypothetical protein